MNAHPAHALLDHPSEKRRPERRPERHPELWLALCCVVLAGLACHRKPVPMDPRKVPASVAPAVEEMPQDDTLSVSLRAVLVQGKSERPLAENETLHSGDHLYFLLRTSQPAYLYAVLFDPAGSASLLFPRAAKTGSASAPRRVAARCPVRIPAEGTFYLQDPAGLQDLRVVASREPLARADRRMCELLQLPCQDVAETEVPICKGDVTRALFSSVKVATASPQGVASLRLLLRQDP